MIWRGNILMVTMVGMVVRTMACMVRMLMRIMKCRKGMIV